ncbi:hypothetical protein L596_013021 [Steinernema carpocapsae]|uniref:Uncharacterized protein n=1 Tax=Steinernema carpocapsae TaxID=34508 RepID=A0A4U5NZE8_STECR|nr:hypothetical protein L596_013021 [Steinernema carpocapsae]
MIKTRAINKMRKGNETNRGVSEDVYPFGCIKSFGCSFQNIPHRTGQGRVLVKGICELTKKDKQPSLIHAVQLVTTRNVEPLLQAHLFLSQRAKIDRVDNSEEVKESLQIDVLQFANVFSLLLEITVEHRVARLSAFFDQPIKGYLQFGGVATPQNVPKSKLGEVRAGDHWD